MCSGFSCGNHLAVTGYRDLETQALTGNMKEPKALKVDGILIVPRCSISVDCAPQTRQFSMGTPAKRAHPQDFRSTVQFTRTLTAGYACRESQALVKWRVLKVGGEQQPEAVTVPRMLLRRKWVFGVRSRQRARIFE